MAKTKSSSPVTKLVSQLVRHHFPGKKISMQELGEGLTNHVYSVQAGRDKLVVRISEQREKINFFLKEQWAVSRAKKMRIPVPDILEVGNAIIPLPYMISRQIQGQTASTCVDRPSILREMGRILSQVHRIPTRGYGHTFNWSRNKLSGNESWKNFLADELEIKKRMSFLRKHKFLQPVQLRHLGKSLKDLEQWKGKTVLQHGDMRLKNVMVDEKGKITAIIDWEECMSASPGLGSFHIAHDLNIDEKEIFLEGYGMPPKKFAELSHQLKAFNILNYVPVLEFALQQGDTRKWNAYKNRLDGSLELFLF